MKRFDIDDDDGELEAKTSYYYYDALGSVRGLSNQKGNLNAEFDYDAFGNGKNNKKWNTYRFSSKEFEDHAGLYYFGARYYDPEIGRWLTPDPFGFIDGPNVYVYTANNPINCMDPWGLRLAVATVSPGAGFGAAGHVFIISGDTAYGTAIFGEENNGILMVPEQLLLNDYVKSGRTVTLFELEESGSSRSERSFDTWVKSTDEGFYCVIGNNCADFVVRGLNESGVLKGNLSTIGYILPPGHGNSPTSVEWSLLIEYVANQGQGIVKTFSTISAGKEKK